MGNNRLSFNQASGKLREMKENLASGKFKSDVLKKINDESKISVSSPRDRMAYLINGVKALTEATPIGEKVFLKITGEISNKYTRREIGMFLREILIAKIYGKTNFEIACYFEKTEQHIKALEELAKLELKESLKKKGFTDDTPSDVGLIIP